MSELQFVVAGPIAGAAFVEIVIRLGTSHRLSTLVEVARKASSVIASNRISDHWKEIAVPTYAALIVRTVAIATVQLALAAALYVALVVAVLSLSMDAALNIATFLGWTLNMGAIAGGVVYALVRQRIAK